MKKKESILIDASIEDVWKYIGTPDSWSQFHAKARDTKLISKPGGRIGARYEMRFSAGHRTSLSTCEIIDIQTNVLISVRSNLDERGQKGSAVMTYEIEELGSGTKVDETIDFDTRHINIFFRMIIKWVAVMGRPKGESSLMKLKRIVEQGSVTQ